MVQDVVTVGLLVTFDALEGKEAEVERFLEGALPLVQQEPATTVWFAIKLGGRTYGIFDVFPDDAGRDAHLNGQVAAALLGSVGSLVSQPEIRKLDVLATRLPGGS